jgi:hypothetical protein
MAALNSKCGVTHEHDDGLPDSALRAHVLRLAMETVEQALTAHGYPQPERGIEILHVALEDVSDVPEDRLN